MRIVINADDFGVSAEVTEEISELLASRIITSTTLMANGDAFDLAVSRAKKIPNASFGVHLNLTSHASLTGADVMRDAGITDENGFFTKKIRQCQPTPQVKEAILAEWTAQVNRVLEAGLEFSHFDSHHHVHTTPWLFMVLKRLQKSFGVRRVRISRTLYSCNEQPASRKLLLQKRMWNFCLRNLYRTRVTAGFTNFITFVELLEGNCLPQLPTLELMVHPGQPTSAKETELLKSDWKSLSPKPLELISYALV